MTVAAEANGLTLTVWQRWRRVLLWLGIYIVVTLVAGCLDMKSAVSRDRANGWGRPAVHLIIRQDEKFLILPERSVPRDEVWGNVLWRHRHENLQGAFFFCYRYDYSRFVVHAWKRPSYEATAEEVAALRPLFADYMQTTYVRTREAVALCLQPDYDRSGIIWAGLIATGLVYSTIITPLLYGLWRLNRLNEMLKLRQKLRRSLLCPNCKYDLRGDRDAGCPECGWGRDREADARRKR